MKTEDIDEYMLDVVSGYQIYHIRDSEVYVELSHLLSTLGSAEVALEKAKANVFKWIRYNQDEYNELEARMEECKD